MKAVEKEKVVDIDPLTARKAKGRAEAEEAIKSNSLPSNFTKGEPKAKPLHPKMLNFKGKHAPPFAKKKVNK